MNSIGAWIMWAGMASVILWLFALNWPSRRVRHFTLEANVSAPASRIWGGFCEHLPSPDTVALHPSIVSIEEVQQNPPTHEYIVDATGGYGTHQRIVQIQILQTRDSEYQQTRTIQLDRKPFPYGPEHVESVSLQPGTSGTTVAMFWRGETETLGEFMALRRANQALLNDIRQFYETGKVPSTRVGPSPRTSLSLSVLAIAAFVLWLGWSAGLFLAAALILHEFGHWFAMKLTGQPAPRIMLVPFFGGVAVANHPHTTLFRDAFCAMMGPGLSAVVSVGFVVTAWVIGAGLNAEYAADPSNVTPDRLARMSCFFTFGLIIGVLNLLQLIPLLPLDGGQVLRAVVQSFHVVWARRAMLGLGGLGVIGFAISGDPLLSGVVALGGLQAWHLSKEAPRARPMSGFGIAVVLVGYVLMAGIHAFAAYTGSQWLRFIV